MLTTCVPSHVRARRLYRARAPGQIRMKEEVGAVDDLGDRSQDALPVDGNQSGGSRRDFLKKAAALGLALPAAGALAGSAAARPSIFVRDRARSRFEGVTLQFAKAPFGTDEKDVIAKLLKPFEAKTGIEGPAHDRSVERRGCVVRDELRGAEPVRRQLPDEHRPHGPRDEGCPRGAEQQAVALFAGVRQRQLRNSSPTRSRRARIRASSTACRASSAAPSCSTTRTCSPRPA